MIFQIAMLTICNLKNSNPNAGDRISVFWPIDNKYYHGTIDSVENSGQQVVKYEDDDVEELNVNNEE